MALWSSSVLPVYRSRVGWNQLHYYGSNIFIRLLCSGVPLCHYYTDNALCRQGCKPSHYIRNFKRQISTVAENFSLPVRTFSREISTGKNNSVHLGQNFQNPLPPKLVGSLNPHFCPNWTEVKKPTSTQVVSKSKKHICATCREVWLQLLHRLCRSWICLKTKKQGTNSLRLVSLLLFDFWCMVNVLL